MNIWFLFFLLLNSAQGVSFRVFCEFGYSYSHTDDVGMVDEACFQIATYTWSIHFLTFGAQNLEATYTWKQFVFVYI